MRYVKIYWIHQHESDPHVIYSEIGTDGYERRKVNLYETGEIGFAFDNIEYNEAGLSEKPFPPLEELNSKDEFDEVKASEIKKDEFEHIWVNRVLPLLSNI